MLFSTHPPAHHFTIISFSISAAITKFSEGDPLLPLDVEHHCLLLFAYFITLVITIKSFDLHYWYYYMLIIMKVGYLSVYKFY
jgi:hypothetical protein